MDQAQPHRTLVVANRTAATPLLLAEVKRRASEQPTQFSLLIPNVDSAKHADWTLERGLEALARAAGSHVEGLVGGQDPFESVKQVIDERDFDDVIISTLPKRSSEWLRRDLPRRVERLGIPVTVITQAAEGDAGAQAAFKAGAIQGFGG